VPVIPRSTADIRELVDAHREPVAALSRTLHDDPELSFEEHRAVAAITAVLHGAGHEVVVGVSGLPTAFRAEAGAGDAEVVLCAEYDALPGVGHACGHNLIAATAVATFLALAPLAEDLGIRLVLLGTPAEEHGTGKELMLQAGAWDDAIASLMVHPGPREMWPSALTMISVHRLRITFRGRPAHAAGAPHLGVNAADAATLSQVALGLLRQQTRETARLNAIVRTAGEATNIIPDLAILDAEVRELTDDALEGLEARMRACFEGAALATGCSVEIEEAEPLYRHLEHDAWLSGRFGERYAELGHAVSPSDAAIVSGSTDMGNVSQIVPSIHPMILVPGAEGTALHTREFAAAAGAPEAIETVVDAAAAMAGTVIDLAGDAEVLERLIALRAHRRTDSA